MISVVKKMTRQYIVSTPHASIIIRRDGDGDAILDCSSATGVSFKTNLRKVDVKDLVDAFGSCEEDWK